MEKKDNSTFDSQAILVYFYRKLIEAEIIKQFIKKML